MLARLATALGTSPDRLLVPDTKRSREAQAPKEAHAPRLRWQKSAQAFIMARRLSSASPRRYAAFALF